MTTATPTSTSAPHRRLRSVSAVLAGLLCGVVLSLATDQALHVLRVYPPWGEPMHEPRLNLLALSYRILYTILGSYLTARLAPSSPWRHVWVLASIGFLVGVAGVVATVPMHLGPAWYPIALAVSAWPCAWAGGALHQRRPPRR